MEREAEKDTGVYRDMKIYLNAREFDVVMKKLFKAVGKKFTSIEKDCETDCSKPDWFMQCSWTMAQEKEFKKWFTEYLTHKLDLSPVAIRKRVDTFCFNYGWKYKDLNDV